LKCLHTLNERGSFLYNKVTALIFKNPLRDYALDR
jgi:hypothetical protein